ncbi:conserved protein of unknown function [Shewanella benthica]|uniref:Uncharacterized protein n=1 Tax=Shewanella benthica TaxID=43661 RepID=A0A330M2R4_9GAMM|nr:hypothetical protein [Shewanella benthica]SQH76969.1 conserved protein of unknown function [Shewanella benthica]
MSTRLECSRRACRWTGDYSTADKRDDGGMKTYICPKCSCDSFYYLPAPVITARVEHANALIKVISEHGRKFFDYNGRIATLELDKNGKVWFVDEYTQRRIYTHYSGRWAGFNNGGTLRSLIESMRTYITKGYQLPLGWIAPTRRNPANGDIWGYGQDAAAAVRKAAATLPIIQTGGKA